MSPWRLRPDSFSDRGSNIDLFPLHFRHLADVMFLAGKKENQTRACGKSDALPQRESHKRRHSNRHLAWRARPKRSVISSS